MTTAADFADMLDCSNPRFAGCLVGTYWATAMENRHDYRASTDTGLINRVDAAIVAALDAVTGALPGLGFSERDRAEYRAAAIEAFWSSFPCALSAKN